MAAAVARDRWFDVRVRGPVAGPDSFGAARALTPVHALNRSRDGHSNRYPRLSVVRLVSSRTMRD